METVSGEIGLAFRIDFRTSMTCVATTMLVNNSFKVYIFLNMILSILSCICVHYILKKFNV